MCLLAHQDNVLIGVLRPALFGQLSLAHRLPPFVPLSISKLVLHLKTRKLDLDDLCLGYLNYQADTDDQFQLQYIYNDFQDILNDG